MSSTASHHQSDLQDYAAPYVCEYCGGPRTEAGSVKGSFCSLDCWYRHKGANALSELRRDHTLCATCFRQIKEVERPPDGVEVNVPPPEYSSADGDGVKNVLVGYQYRTPDTEIAVDDFSNDPYRTQERTRWSCTCGNVDPSQRDDVLESIELESTISNLFRALLSLEEKGTVAKRPDKDRLFAALREKWRDWEYAVGRALYG